MIQLSYTRANPETMVIKLPDTVTAILAVFSSVWHNQFTMFAVSPFRHDNLFYISQTSNLTRFAHLHQSFWLFILLFRRPLPLYQLNHIFIIFNLRSKFESSSELWQPSWVLSSHEILNHLDVLVLLLLMVVVFQF